MAKLTVNETLKGLTAIAKNGVSKVDVESIKDKASSAKEKAAAVGGALSEKASEVKDSAVSVKEDIENKLTELDRMLEASITEYNDAYTLMNDKGLKLFIERTQSIDTISFIENLVNSIANKPKTFESDFEEINTYRNSFISTTEFADRELQAARVAAGGAGAGLAAGTSVAFMAPTAAMWVATTFGTASTGTAISALSGAAATNAALAWLGGGTLAAGGGGIAAGNALLALAGPIGWTIAGASLLSSIVLFANKRVKINKEKNSEIEAVKQNIESVKEMDAKITSILTQTVEIRTGLNNLYKDSLAFFNKDYSMFADEEKKQLGQLVNSTKALSALLGKAIE